MPVDVASATTNAPAAGLLDLMLLQTLHRSLNNHAANKPPKRIQDLRTTSRTMKFDVIRKRKYGACSVSSLLTNVQRADGKQCCIRSRVAARASLAEAIT